MEDVAVPESWIVDPDTRTMRVVRAGQADALVTDTMSWRPAGAAVPLSFAMQEIFGERQPESDT